MTRLLTVCLLATVLAWGTAACGSGSTDRTAQTLPPPTVSPVDPSTAANVTGRITFEGTAPTPAVIRMDSDPNCVEPGSTSTDEQIVVGDGGGLQNVFVYVKDGLGDLRFPIPATSVLLDQKGCHYTPHVFGVQVGQSVEILNSDATLHNVHAAPRANQEFNIGQPLAGMKHTHQFSTAEVMVPFKCDVHPWMHAWVGVLDHPYFAVTAPDGSFSLQGLPPGTYTVEAWHERLGTQTQTVTVGASDTQEIAFAFRAP